MLEATIDRGVWARTTPEQYETDEGTTRRFSTSLYGHCLYRPYSKSKRKIQEYYWHEEKQKKLRRTVEVWIEEDERLDVWGCVLRSLGVNLEPHKLRMSAGGMKEPYRMGWGQRLAISALNDSPKMATTEEQERAIVEAFRSVGVRVTFTGEHLPPKRPITRDY